MLAITLGLGVWQVERLRWKTALLSEIDVAEQAPPIRLQADPTPFRRVVVQGRFVGLVARYGAEVRMTSSGLAVMGSQVVQTLRRDDGSAVLVMRGWAPAETQPDTPAGMRDVVGYVREPDHPGLFSLHDDPAHGTYYTLDPQVVAAGLGAGPVAPFTVVALAPLPPPGVYPEPAQTLPRPPNDHLGYAITWFALSAALVVIFVVFARQTLMQPTPGSGTRPRAAR